MGRIVENESSYAASTGTVGGTTVQEPSAHGSSFATERGRVSARARGAITKTKGRESKESLFERFAWLYVFFREKLFRDDTERFIEALWPVSAPPDDTSLMEIGCGPGFYSCAIATRFPAISVVGIDRSAEQLNCARRKAQRLRLANCDFATDNVLELSYSDATFDAVIAARLFTVLPRRDRAIAEMHRVLRPGGQCLIAEPRYAIWASLPLLAMWLIASVARMNNGYCEPRTATVLAPAAFRNLFATQPWKRIETWQDGRYQYALCEKR